MYIGGACRFSGRFYVPPSVSFIFPFILFLRAISQADAEHPFDECREGQIPRSSAALQV